MSPRARGRLRLVGEHETAPAAGEPAFAHFEEASRAARQEGRLEEAIAHLRRALEEDPLLPPADFRRWGARSALAAMLAEAGRLEDAEALYDEAARCADDILGPSHREIGCALLNCAESRMARGRPTEAMPFFERAIGIFACSPSRPQALLGMAKVRWAAAAGETGDPGGAARCAADAVGILSEGPQPSPLLAMALGVQAASLRASGRADEARFVEARLQALEAAIDTTSR